MIRFTKPTKIEWYSFLAPMPLIAFGINHILFHNRIYQDYRIWLFSFPLIYVIGFISWYTHVAFSHAVQRKYPDLNQSPKRIIVKALANLLIMSPSILFIVYLYHALHILGYNITLDDSIKCLLVGMSVNLIFVTLWEATYIMEKMRESHSEKEMLQQLSINQEFESLKSQVNPHFLFNCFNTLSSLITEDRQQAEVFLNELSKVYRYLLKNNRDGMSTVEDELKFIHSYYRLLRTRYGTALQLHTEIDKRYYPYLLPSLSLQLLVENAVKHNVVSKQQPLAIEIFTTAANKLVVNNNLQRKHSKVTSTKIGLENLKAKYKLLQQTEFQVIEDMKNYMVVLPLIWNNTAENKIIKPVENAR